MTGTIYGVMALALVLINRSTQMFNFSQGEMATFTTYLAWSILGAFGIGILGLSSYGLVFPMVLIIAFMIGAAMERGLIRLVEGTSPIALVIMGFGLFLAVNSLSSSIYGPLPHAFEQPFRGSPIDIRGITFAQHNLYLALVAIGLTSLIYGLFQFTKLGLAMRATAQNRPAAELMGVPTGLMLMVGWGLATTAGAAAGMLIAPIVVLTPSMMFFVLLFGFASAVLGGLDSPPGAIVGGILVGIIQDLTGTYIDDVVGWIPSLEIQEPNQYRDVVAIGLIIVVLAIRPRGLFGAPIAQRV
jgi:branched-chain amino acid transport system permease protein